MLIRFKWWAGCKKPTDITQQNQLNLVKHEYHVVFLCTYCRWRTGEARPSWFASGTPGGRWSGLDPGVTSEILLNTYHTTAVLLNCNSRHIFTNFFIISCDWDEQWELNWFRKLIWAKLWASWCWSDVFWHQNDHLSNVFTLPNNCCTSN